MKKNDMKNIYGKAPQSFHYAIMRSLNKLEEKQTVKPKSRVVRKVVACALVAVIGTAGVITAKAVYPMVVNREGNYGMSIEVEPSTSGSDVVNLSLDANTANAPEYIKLNIGWLPDGVVKNQGKYSLDGEFKEKGFTFVTERVVEKKTFTDDFIDSYEEFTVNGNNVILAHVNNVNTEFTKRFYIFFEKECTFLTCYVSDDVSDDEIKKVIENITVTEGTEDDHDSVSLSEYKDSVSGNLSDAFQEKIQQAYDAWVAANTTINFSTVELGQTIGYGFEDFGDVTGLDFSIDNIEVKDNIAGLDVNYFDQIIADDINSYIDSNGNILPHTREIYKYGDGINSGNELIASDNVNRKLVYVTVTVNNTSDTEKDFYLYQINIDRLRDNNGVLCQASAVEDNLPDLASRGEISWIDNNNVDRDGYQHGFYFLNIPSNSSKIVHLGFLADEDMLDELYVTVDGSWCGAIYDSNSKKFINNENQETDFGYACIKVQ